MSIRLQRKGGGPGGMEDRFARVLEDPFEIVVRLVKKKLTAQSTLDRNRKRSRQEERDRGKSAAKTYDWSYD